MKAPPPVAVGAVELNNSTAVTRTTAFLEQLSGDKTIDGATVGRSSCSSAPLPCARVQSFKNVDLFVKCISSWLTKWQANKGEVRTRTHELEPRNCSQLESRGVRQQMQY